MMGGVGLILVVGLIILATVVIRVVRSYDRVEIKSKRKNDALPRNDRTYSIGDDGEIIEYSEEKAKRHI